VLALSAKKKDKNTNKKILHYSSLTFFQVQLKLTLRIRPSVFIKAMVLLIIFILFF